MDAVEVPLSENAVRVLRARYLARGPDGEPSETPEGLFLRVARAVAEAERRHAPDPAAGEARVREMTDRFYRMIRALRFLPNSPTLMNAGRELGQFFACFVLPVADAVATPGEDGIFDIVRTAARIHQSGGGTGFSFSRIRPEGSLVASSGGRASGPVSFMRVFNEATRAINQGGFRRGANMAVLSVDHPDILDFVDLKADPREMTNFNVSAGVTEDFFRAVREGRVHLVRDPRTGEERPLRAKRRDAAGNLRGRGERSWTARELFDRIVQRAWESGEPGLVFLDRVNRDNPTPRLGAIEATNPCGEVPLLPWEACNLASIHLARFVRAPGERGAGNGERRGDAQTDGLDPRIDWAGLREQVRLGVRFLDDVIDVTLHPHPKIAAIVSGNRKVGLGVMGFADLLFALGVPYDTEEAVSLGSRVMRFLKDEGWRASMELAAERGPFPNFEGSLFTDAPLDHPYLSEGYRAACRASGRRVPIRNATVTTVAPTGTISILAGASGGVEPAFSISFFRNVLNGERLPEAHPAFFAEARRRGFDRPGLFEEIAETGTLHGVPGVPEDVRRVFLSSRDIAPEWHLRMQAAFQASTDNAVSKTVNFPRAARPDDVRRVFELAAELWVKGVTIYRDGSRAGQAMALSAGAPKGRVRDRGAPPSRRPIPDVLKGTRYRIPTNLGNAYVTITEDERGIREIFTSLGKTGSDISAASEAICRLISTALGYGVPVEALAEQLRNITSTPVPGPGGWVKSLPDAIGQVLVRHLRERGGAPPSGGAAGTPTGALCPECGQPLLFEEGCVGGKCRSCGFSRC